MPRVSYAISVWGHTVSTRTSILSLAKLQRRALLGITTAYRTASTEALQVIAGIPPLDLELAFISRSHRAKTLNPPQRDLELSLAKRDLMEAWQERWSSSSKGRHTYKWFPSVATRLDTPIWLSHPITQFLSGHGNFRAKLYQFTLADSPLCSLCQVDDTPEHQLYVCTRLHSPRAYLELAVHRAGHLWPCDLRVLTSSKAVFTAFAIFAKSAIEPNL